MWVGVQICPQISLCFPISNFTYNLTFSLSVSFFWLSFIILLFIFVFLWLESLHWDFNLYLFCNYIFFNLFCNLYFYCCCNPQLHKCLFLPSGHWFVKHLDLLIYSCLHFHWRIYGFEWVCGWESLKAFLVHFWLAGPFFPCSFFSMALLGSGLPAREVGDN